MLLKCTPDGRRIKVNGTPVQHGNIARGMKMTMSTTATMSARVHRKVMRAPHKRAHPGKMTSLGKMAAHSGKLVHPGKMIHPGKLSHLGRFGKLQHYAHTTHSLRPPEPCGDSNDSGLGPDHDQRHSFNRLSETGEEWSGMEPKRSRSETDVKLECDDAIDEFAFAPRQHTYAACPAPAPTDNHLVPPLIRASSSISSPGQMAESPGKRFQEHSFRSCGKLGNSGKLASKYPGGGKIMSASGKLANGGKLGGKLGGKYGGKLAQALARRRALAMQTGPSGLASPLTNRSRDGTVELQILCQPETQHRARYQTEGSRGAVKDNSGNGFPIVKLVGYDKPAILQVYIGTDTGRVAPHMFYQACRVSGKNSTPCKERKDDGTVIIEIELEPAKNWQVTCDCVGILKERNVDVEHRFGESLSGSNAGPAHMSRGKKKSTRCRMVFRTEIINHDGQAETLQVCSTQIICTQPPGVPEVCRKSLVSCPATGGLELYLLGKNFLKETRVVFSQRQDGRTVWEEEVIPDKEFLQQSHLVCCVPPYPGDIVDPVQVHVFVRSGGRASEPHSFYYTPPAHDSGPMHCTRHHTQGHDERMPWSAGRASSLAGDEPALKAELEDSVDREQDAPRADDVVDLRLKTEATFSAFPDGSSSSSSPPAVVSFTRQLQAIQTQVQTDKMVESVAAAIFNTEDGVARPLDADILLASLGETGGLERRLARQSAQMEALVEDAMKATAAMMPGDSDKLDELVNSRADAHLSAAAPSAQMSPESLAVTPPAAVKSMILTAAAEILSSDSTMDALVTSAINTANILTTEEAPLTQTASEPTSEAPLAAAVSAAVTQAMSQAVSQVVSAAVTQEMAAPVQRLTDMSDSDLLSYINPSTFDQV